MRKIVNLVTYTCMLKWEKTRSTQRAQTSLAETDHYSHIAHCKNVESWWWKTTPTKKKEKSFGSLPAPQSGYATTIMLFFAHLLILEYPDHLHNLISSSLYYPGPLHKISSQSIHNFLSNVVHKQTNKQTNRQTNATKNITSFAKEVIIAVNLIWENINYVKVKLNQNIRLTS